MRDYTELFTTLTKCDMPDFVQIVYVISHPLIGDHVNLFLFTLKSSAKNLMTHVPCCSIFFLLTSW